jgi:hypothetical protein
MRNKALLILAFRNVLPKTLHACTMWSDWTTAIVMLTFGRVAQQQQTLLLVSQHLLTI